MCATRFNLFKPFKPIVSNTLNSHQFLIIRLSCVQKVRCPFWNGWIPPLNSEIGHGNYEFIKENPIEVLKYNQNTVPRKQKDSSPTKSTTSKNLLKKTLWNTTRKSKTNQWQENKKHNNQYINTQHTNNKI